MGNRHTKRFEEGDLNRSDAILNSEKKGGVSRTNGGRTSVQQTCQKGLPEKTPKTTRRYTELKERRAVNSYSYARTQTDV